MMKTQKKLIEQAILFAIDSIKEDITVTPDIDENIKRAEAIKLLTEGYRNMQRWKK